MLSTFRSHLKSDLKDLSQESEPSLAGCTSTQINSAQNYCRNTACGSEAATASTRASSIRPKATFTLSATAGPALIRGSAGRCSLGRLDAGPTGLAVCHENRAAHPTGPKSRWVPRRRPRRPERRRPARRGRERGGAAPTAAPRLVRSRSEIQAKRACSSASALRSAGACNEPVQRSAAASHAEATRDRQRRARQARPPSAARSCAAPLTPSTYWLTLHPSTALAFSQREHMFEHGRPVASPSAAVFALSPRSTPSSVSALLCAAFLRAEL